MISVYKKRARTSKEETAMRVKQKIKIREEEKKNKREWEIGKKTDHSGRGVRGTP